MEPHPSDEQEARLSLAEFSAAVREGIAQADRGELIHDDEVRLWLSAQARRLR